MMKMFENPPWWAWSIFGLSFIGAAFIAHSELFPDPHIMKLNEELHIHQQHYDAHNLNDYRNAIIEIQTDIRYIKEHLQ